MKPRGAHNFYCNVIQTADHNRFYGFEYLRIKDTFRHFFIQFVQFSIILNTAEFALKNNYNFFLLLNTFVI